METGLAIAAIVITIIVVVVLIILENDDEFPGGGITPGRRGRGRGSLRLGAAVPAGATI